MTSKILLFFFTLSLFCSCLNNNSNKTEEEKPTYKISSLVDTFKNSSEEIPELKQIDSAKIIELKKYVNIKKDEFKETNWYTPKTAPLYRNQNGIYCYFSADSIRVGYLRLVIQYYADDWLFIEQYKFVIDGVAYTHIPKEVERDNGYGGYIWEWCDDWLSKEDEIFIKALANAKVAKVRYEGSQYYKEKIITAQQIKAINTAYELHKAMGGKLPLPP